MNRLLKFGKRAIFASGLTIVLVKIYTFSASYFRLHNPVSLISPHYQDKWKSLPNFSRRLVGNMIVGLGISLLLIALHDTPFHRGMEDAALDWMMKMYSGTPPQKDAVPFAFLDIDDATHRLWGEPYITPRDKILELLRFALSGNPATVVIDIDLSRRAGNGDTALEDFIRQYPSNQEAGSSPPQDNPPIILSRIFRPAADATNGINYEIRPSFLDQAVATAPLVYWASPLFDIDEDFAIRGWRPWEITCGRNAVQITPSVQLLAYLQLRMHQIPSDAVNDMHRQLSISALSYCETHESVNSELQADKLVQTPDHQPLIIGDLKLHHRKTNLSRRFIYEVPWKLEPGETRPILEYQEKMVPALSTRSAGVITQQAGMVDSAWLAGHIVIIGGSYQEGRDIFPTPIGQMPGALVLINAIHSLLQYGELKPPPLWIMLLVQALLIIFISAIFSRFDSFWGMLASGGLVILLLLPVSFWIFRYGIWVDFALPLLAVQFHHMAMEFREDSAKQESE